MNYFKGVLLFLFTSLLLSCSEDDPVVNPEPELAVETGVFIDSEVEGLQYSTETQEGVTNSDGEFNYIEGETVTFSVGEIILGSAPAGPEMSPVSIATTPNATVETEEVKNIAAFLQTLDTDNDPTNGILIEAATVEAISITSIDFTQPIYRILGEIVAEVNLSNDSNLSVVYPETAAEHLAGTLGEEYEADDPVFDVFIPYLESRYGTTLNSFYWIHETDEEGKLVKSYQYEKYPNQLAFEVTYNEFNEEGQPISFEEVRIWQGEENRRTTTTITYAEDGSVESSISTIPDYTPDGDYWIQRWYTQFDDEKRVVEYEFTRTPDTAPTRSGKIIYDEEGNIAEQLGYNLLTGEQTSRIIYTYTEWGDKESEKSLDAAGNEIARFDNYYREDRTLERQVYTASGQSSTTNYDENEGRITD